MGIALVCDLLDTVFFYMFKFEYLFIMMVYGKFKVSVIIIDSYSKLKDSVQKITGVLW